MKTDMSPEAVTARLKKTSELRQLCISLGGNRLRKKLQDADVRRMQQQSEPDEVHSTRN